MNNRAIIPVVVVLLALLALPLILSKFSQRPSGGREAVDGVTQAQWQYLMDANPSEFQGPDLPVENVSWRDCQGFINRLNETVEGWRFLRGGFPWM